MAFDVATANPERGELDLVVTRAVAGLEQECHYTLKLSTNVAIVFETQHKKTMGQLLAEAGSLSFESIRFFLWLLLQKYHADEFKQISAVGELIDDAGGVALFLAKIQEIVDLNKKPEKGKDGGTAANPPDAPGGTGASSTDTPGA